jgi:[protein-PII] uridylyltransferase
MPASLSDLAPTLQKDLAACGDAKALTQLLLEQRATWRAHWTPHGGGWHWMRNHSDLHDALLRRLFTLAAERAENDTRGVALIATGGYGQRLLAPYSDIDLTLLVEREDDPAILRETFRLVMEVLMTGAKLKVGYAYRPIPQTSGSTLDHQSQTALLDARFLAGDSGLFGKFDRSYSHSLQIADFLFSKSTEREKTRQKIGESPYQVEPDIKDGGGGLRDLQSALWMAQVRFGRSGDALWRVLTQRKIITTDEQKSLLEAREHLLTVRNLLHLVTQSPRNTMSMQRQEEMATRLGFENTPDGPPGVEKFMQGHYQKATTIAHLSSKITQRCLDAPLALGNQTGLAAVKGTVTITDPAQIKNIPYWPLRALEFCQTYQLELASQTIEAIESAIELPLPPEAGEAFLNLLALPGDLEKTMRRMDRTGLLRAMLPELADCMGLVPYDPSHAWTVGEHTLKVFGHLNALRPEMRAKNIYPPYAEAYDLVASPATLFLGALLHDIGKQWPQTLSGVRAPHEITGAERVPLICQRLGASPEMTRRVIALVRWHLLLAEVSRLRDLTRPESIQEVIEPLEDSDMLTMLYIHTWADTSAVGPGIWTQMNAQLLDELFARTQEAFSHTPDTDTPSETDRRLIAQRERLTRRLAHPESGEASTPESVREHIEAMPAAYLFNTQPEAMTLHLVMLATLATEDGPVIDLRPLAGTTQMALTIVTWDDPGPGLLAKITGVLYMFDITLYTAQVFSRTYAQGKHAALDTLTIDFRDQLLSRSMRTDLTNALTQILRGQMSLEELQTRKRRENAHRGTTKSLQITPNPNFVLLDVEILRGTGSFFALCQALTENAWNIETARIAAWGGNLRCAFYLTDTQKISPETKKDSPEALKALLGNRIETLSSILS